jgi:hypothetical protein
MSCGGSMKKMAVGGTTTKRIIKKSTGGMYGIPQENLGTSGQYGFAKKGGATKKMQNGGMIPRCPGPNCPKKPITGPIKAIKKVVKKITRPLRKAQNGIEMDDNMMINKPGSTSGYKAPVRPGIEYMSGKPGLSGRTPGRTRPNARPAMTRSEMINLGKDKNTPYYGMSEEDMINKGTISKPPYKKGGATKAAKFAALAPPYNKATFADKIVGAKKNAKMQKGGSVKKTTLSPNSFRYNNGIGVATNEKGKINFISQSQNSHQPNNVHTNSKDFRVIRKPTYTVSSDDFNVKNKKIYNKKTNFEKSIDTTGYSKGKKSFDVISKFSLPGGNMKKITTVKTNRKGALDTIKRMKNEAKKPFKKKK